MVVDEIYWLDQIQPSYRSAVGDKAFYLGLLMQRGYPSFPGLVVSATVLQHFLAHMDWQERLFADLPHSFLYVDANNPRQLQSVARQIQQAIQSTPLPEPLLNHLQSSVESWQTPAVIFRPSFSLQPGLDPTISYKSIGLLGSYICNTNRTALAQGLKRTWSELFRARSLFYWQRLGLQLQHVQLAVLVQPIQSVLAAGDLQVVGDQVEVQAVWGLGHGLLQGTADRYSFDLQSGLQTHQLGHHTYAYRIAASDAAASTALSGWLLNGQTCLQLDLIEEIHSGQLVLTLAQLQQLAQLAQRAQTDMGMPLTLEWTLDSTVTEVPTFHLTQVMPQLGPWRRVGPQASSIEPELLLSSQSQLIGLAAAPGKTVGTAWLIGQDVDPMHALAAVPEGSIVIATMITPDQVIQLRQVAGIVTEQGGMTSHAAILARELKIPAVVGVRQVTERIRTGDRVAIDGDRGLVYWGDFELPATWQQAETARAEPSSFYAVEPAANQPSAKPDQLTANPTRTQLFVTLSQLDHLNEVAALPVDGVGLLRSELMLLDLFEQTHPDVWFSQRDTAEIVEQISQRVEQFAAAFAPRPVFYRSLDLRSHEFVTDQSGSLHPTLGIRGALSYQFNPDLFRVQLAALKQVQQQGFSNVSLILPFVRTVEEFVFCRQQIEQVGLTQDSQFQLWIMAEVPSVLFLLPDYVAAGVQGMAIGTNDLTQLLLGVDRDHPQMAAAFNPHHVAVVRAIHQLIKTALQARIPCSICGQSFQQTNLLSALLQWGITAISVDPGEVEFVFQAMQRFYRSS
jgi:pyruvate, water dikinase